MMRKAGGIDRRGALTHLGLIAVLPSLVSGTAHAAGVGNSVFRPPAGPMLFTRRLLRELPGGAAIIVTRSLEVRFVPNAAGYRVEGNQSSAQVSAPPVLAALARLEEQRQETGMFPAQLDHGGRIIAGPGGGVADLGQAVDESFAWLARRPLTRTARAEAQEFLIGLQTVAARITTAVPSDLFTGNAAPVERTQQLTMPDGNPGRVSVSYTGTANAAGGLLAKAQRVVTTDAGGTALRSIEEWTLEPLAITASR